MCRRHSTTVKNYYNFSSNYVRNINIGYKCVMVKTLGIKIVQSVRSDA